MQFLDWFVKEQGEEEKNAEDLIKKMKLYGEDAKGLYMLNSEMAARVYHRPLSRACDPNLLCAEQDRNGLLAPLFRAQDFLDSTFL